MQVPCSDAGIANCITLSIYSASMPLPLLSCECNDSCTLWGREERRRIALTGKVPLDVSTVLKPFSRAIRMKSGRRGWSIGSPMRWKYRKIALSRSRSVTRSNSCALIRLSCLLCFGQKSQLRLHTLVISI